MNNKDLNESVDQLIPRFVGHYNRSSDEKIAQIIELDSRTDQTLVEKRLSNFFKCTKHFVADANSGQGHVKCFATRNSEINFSNHLNESHPNDELFCCYCYPKVSDKITPKKYNHRYLIKHMIKRHRYRRYQCNQCLYRAVSEDHVNIHQSQIHVPLHSRPISHEPNRQSTQESIPNENVCNILRCLSISSENSMPNLYYYYNKFKTERFNTDGKNETLFQCLYCDFMDENLRQVVNHCVDRHLDYPIMYYIPEPTISSSTNCRVEVDIPDTVIESTKVKTEPQDNSVSSTCALIAPRTTDESENRLDVEIEKQNDGLDKGKTPDECENDVDITARRRKSAQTDCDVSLNSYENSAKRQQNANDSLIEAINSSINDQIIDSKSNNSIGVKTIVNTNNELSDNNSDKCGEIAVQRLVCLFCDQLFIDREVAKTHLESHLPSIAEAIDDFSVTKLINEWIEQFLLKQSQLASYESTSKQSDNLAYYRCPLCVKISLIVKQEAKRYRSFSEAKTHLWQHSCWMSVRCKVCSSNLPNCDPLIAKHIIDCHQLLLTSLKNQNLEFLFKNQSVNNFTVKQRLALEETFIELIRDQVIDLFINRLLVDMSEQYEQQLRVINNCHRFVVKTIINRLPKINFNDEDEIKNYVKRWEKEEKRRKYWNKEKVINDESDEEVVKPRKRVKFLEELEDFVDQKCMKSKKRHQIENFFHKSNDIESKGSVKNKDRISKDVVSLGKQIEKVYNEAVSINNDLKNGYKALQLSTNERIERISNCVTDCTPSTSHDNSSEASIPVEKLPVIKGDKESNQVNEISIDEYYRISCYHCSEKFKNMKEYRLHHSRQHHRLVMRCFGKERIRPLINDK